MRFFSSCPPGTVKRKSYTRKNTGKHVKSTCVSVSEKSRKVHRCPPGTIPRTSYVRRISEKVKKEGYLKRTQSGKLIRVFPHSNTVEVSRTCVEDKGSGSAQKTGPAVKKGELLKHGYSYKLPEQYRLAALQKAVQEYGAAATYKKLNTAAASAGPVRPEAANVFRRDRNWIKNTYHI